MKVFLDISLDFLKKKKKISKKEKIKKIYEKYTNHFSSWLHGNYVEKSDEGEVIDFEKPKNETKD